MFIRTILIILVALAMVGSSDVVADQPAPTAYIKLAPTLKNPSLTSEQKLGAIRQYFSDDPDSYEALSYVRMVDPAEAGRRMRIQFDNPQRTLEEKLKFARLLLNQKDLQSPGFIDHYAPWLIEQVLAWKDKTGEVLYDHQITPVEEYANIARSFQGHSTKNFDKIKDKRLIPVLIAALDAPDRVYGAQQGCCIHGPVGTSTGRNLGRQQVPIALAKLGAPEAVPKLRSVLENHRDWNLRDNAAFALGVLMDAKDRPQVVKFMRDHRCISPQDNRIDFKADRYHHLFAFGRGLIARGDEAGIEFMSFKYSHYFHYDTLSETAYMAQTHTDVIKGFMSKKLAGYFEQAFDYTPLMNVLLFDADKVKINDYGHTQYDLAAEPRITELFDTMATCIEANELVSLRPTFQKIADQSQGEDIKKRAALCVERLTQ